MTSPVNINIFATMKNSYFARLHAVVWLTFSGCATSSDINLRPYYFPVENLKIGRVYRYETTQNDLSMAEYGYFKTLERDTGVFLASTFYDQNFSITQIRSEKITPSGSIAKDCFLFEPDKKTDNFLRVQSTVKSPDLYPFRVSDTLGIYLYSLSYHPKNDTTSTNYIIRNRRYLGTGGPFILNEISYPCIRMEIREIIGNEQEGSWETEGIGEEWYARGLGLVYYRKSYDQGKLILETKLKETFPMSELEKRAGGR
jgi:hypothetical protein